MECLILQISFRVKACRDGRKFTDVMTSFKGKKCTFFSLGSWANWHNVFLSWGEKNLNQNKAYGPVPAPTYITLPWIILASWSLMRPGISPYMTKISIKYLRIESFRHFSIYISQLLWYIHASFFLSAAAHLMTNLYILQILLQLQWKSGFSPILTYEFNLWCKWVKFKLLKMI